MSHTCHCPTCSLPPAPKPSLPLNQPTITRKPLPLHTPSNLDWSTFPDREGSSIFPLLPPYRFSSSTIYTTATEDMHQSSSSAESRLRSSTDSGDWATTVASPSPTPSLVFSEPVPEVPEFVAVDRREEGGGEVWKRESTTTRDLRRFVEGQGRVLGMIRDGEGSAAIGEERKHELDEHGSEETVEGEVDRPEMMREEKWEVLGFRYEDMQCADDHEVRHARMVRRRKESLFEVVRDALQALRGAVRGWAKEGCEDGERGCVIFPVGRIVRGLLRRE